jgi:hypothetical protein
MITGIEVRDAEPKGRGYLRLDPAECDPSGVCAIIPIE